MKSILEGPHRTPGINITFNEALLCAALCVMTFFTVFLGSRAIAYQRALDLSLHNRIIMAIPATDRTNINYLQSYEKNR